MSTEQGQDGRLKRREHAGDRSGHTWHVAARGRVRWRPSGTQGGTTTRGGDCTRQERWRGAEHTRIRKRSEPAAAGQAPRAALCWRCDNNDSVPSRPLPPRHIPPNHTKPNPKANGGQPGRERANLRSRAKELDNERTRSSYPQAVPRGDKGPGDKGPRVVNGQKPK